MMFNEGLQKWGISSESVWLWIISTTCEFSLTMVQWRGTQTLSDPNLFALSEVTRARSVCYRKTHHYYAVVRLFWIVRQSLVCSVWLQVMAPLPTQFKRAHPQFSPNICDVLHSWEQPLYFHPSIFLHFFPLNLTVTEQCSIVCVWWRATAVAKQTAVSLLHPTLLLSSPLSCSCSTSRLWEHSLRTFSNHVQGLRHARYTNTDKKTTEWQAWTGCVTA